MDVDGGDFRSSLCRAVSDTRFETVDRRGEIIIQYYPLRWASCDRGAADISGCSFFSGRYRIEGINGIVSATTMTHA